MQASFKEPSSSERLGRDEEPSNEISRHMKKFVDSNETSKIHTIENSQEYERIGRVNDTEQVQPESPTYYVNSNDNSIKPTSPENDLTIEGVDPAPGVLFSNN